MEGQDEQTKSRVVKVDSVESWDLFVSQANNQGCPIVVHFTASWCMPSVAMNSFFEEVAAAYPDVLFLCVDVDDVKTGMASPDNPNNWVFDYALLEDIHGELPSLDPPQVLWPSSAPDHPLPLSVDFDDSFGNFDAVQESGSRKRVRSRSCSASATKACREKMRRDRLNDRFLELGSVLDPGRPPKMDKVVLLSDAVRMVIQLRDEAQKLKDANESLLEKINELKAEKNELRDEKQRLKTEKENLDRQVKALSTQPGFLPHPPAIPAPFCTPGQVVGGKLVPFVGCPGVSMWQFMPPAAVDTSQDHNLRPPVA